MATKVQSTLRTQRGAAAELKGFMYRRNRSIGMAPGNSENIMISRAMLEAKRWARNAFGFALLVLGIIAIPTPGPGLSRTFGAIFVPGRCAMNRRPLWIVLTFILVVAISGCSSSHKTPPAVIIVAI